MPKKANNAVMHTLPAWIQAFAVIIGLLFAIQQIGLARHALESSAKSNEVAADDALHQRTLETSDLLRAVNEAALAVASMSEDKQNDRSSGYSPAERLFILRLQYLERVYLLRDEKMINDSRWIAETAYRDWVVRDGSFSEIWTRQLADNRPPLKDQFFESFSLWIDEGITK